MALKIKPQAIPDPSDAIRIGSVRTFLDALEKLDRDSRTTYFYRGHPSSTFSLQPSIYRDPRLIANEDVMFKELLLRCSADFASLDSTFQTLVKMQHYGLPTRLLDLTANPLIALYFACDPYEPKAQSGEVLAFAVPTSEVKYFDSDTVSVIANIARRPKSFEVPPIELDLAEFNKTPEIRYLLHEIKQEKPYFEPGIKREHLGSVVCVRPKLNNPRIIRQDGAFFLFGVSEYKAIPAKMPPRYIASTDSKRMLVIATEKPRIRSQLEALGISRSTVFPEIDRVAEFLKSHFAPPSEA